MYICSCNAVTESQIQALAEQGVKTMRELGMVNACSTTCGCCYERAEEVLKAAQKTASRPLFSIPLLNTANINT